MQVRVKLRGRKETTCWARTEEGVGAQWERALESCAGKLKWSILDENIQSSESVFVQLGRGRAGILAHIF